MAPVGRCERRSDEQPEYNRMALARAIVLVAMLGFLASSLVQVLESSLGSSHRAMASMYEDISTALPPITGQRGIMLMEDAIERDNADSSTPLLPAAAPAADWPSPYAHWTVVVTVSRGFDDMFANWLTFYRRLGLDSAIVLVAEDSATWAKYSGAPGIAVKQGFEASDEATAPGALDHKTEGYKRLVSKRPRHLLWALAAHSTVVYADIDAVWLEDPRPYFVGDYDMWGALDGHIFRGKERPFFCTGFMALRDTPAVLGLLGEWDRQLTRKTDINQMVFNDILVRGLPGPQIKIRALDDLKFPWGQLYFEQLSAQQKREAAVVHNNFVVGKDNKIARFRAEGMWLVR